MPFQAASGPVTLRLVNSTFAYAGGQAIFEGILGGYRDRHPNVSIDVEYLTNAAAVADRVRAGFAAETPPDVFIIETGWLEESFAAQDQLFNVKNSRSRPANSAISSWPCSRMPCGKGISTDCRSGLPPPVLLYRKDHFGEVGLNPEQPPRSWEESWPKRRSS